MQLPVPFPFDDEHGCFPLLLHQQHSLALLDETHFTFCLLLSKDREILSSLLTHFVIGLDSVCSLDSFT